MIKIAADFTQREIVHSDELPWVQSPMLGVERRALDRVGGEVARATTIVRYAPGSSFSAHTHTGGEEFIVLDGVFQDEHGDYPVGSYVRNPPESRHNPCSINGCVILVKLWQFQPEDRTHVRLEMNTMDGQPHVENSDVNNTLLYKDLVEEVSLLRLKAGAKLNLLPNGGAELFIIKGSAIEGINEQLNLHSWARFPIGNPLSLVAGEAGAEIWIKTGHLADVDNQITRVKQA